MTIGNFDREVRLFLFTSFANHSSSPGLSETASHFGISVEEAQQSYQRLADAHMIVLKPGTHEVIMAMPFSSIPTSYRVEGQSQSWWANCAWDALGISVALKQEVKIISNCPDCGDSVVLHAPPQNNYRGFREVVHYALPPQKWWDDIFFT